MPADYQLLLEHCWASDPADRPSADKLLGCLSVMAAERHLRINPDAAAAFQLDLPASPGAAVAALRGQQQRPQQLGAGGASLWRQDNGSVRSGRQFYSAGQLPVVGMSPPGGAEAATAFPGGSAGAGSAGGSLLLQHKSCPAAAFEAFLQQSGASLYGCSPTSAAGGDSGNILLDAGVAATGADTANAAVRFAEELQEEHEMLQQLRASSLTQSGPGSVPVLHSSQPHQRYADGHGHFDMQLSGLDDAHTWHI